MRGHSRPIDRGLTIQVYFVNAMWRSTIGLHWDNIPATLPRKCEYLGEERQRGSSSERRPCHRPTPGPARTDALGGGCRRWTWNTTEAGDLPHID